MCTGKRFSKSQIRAGLETTSSAVIDEEEQNHRGTKWTEVSNDMKRTRRWRDLNYYFVEDKRLSHAQNIVHTRFHAGISRQPKRISPRCGWTENNTSRKPTSTKRTSSPLMYSSGEGVSKSQITKSSSRPAHGYDRPQSTKLVSNEKSADSRNRFRHALAARHTRPTEGERKIMGFTQESCGRPICVGNERGREPVRDA